MSLLSKQKVRARARTKYRIRKRITAASDRARLSVFRSSKHIYAQIVLDSTGKTLASASTLDKEFAGVLKGIEGVQSDDAKVAKSTKSVIAARAVGMLVARRGLSISVSEVVFDRNGFNYSGRIKALADGAREAGLVN